MKIILLLTLSISAFAQTTGQICFQPDKTVPTKQVCRDITPAVRQSLVAFVAEQKDNAGAPKYNGVADLLFSHLNALMLDLLDKFPSATIQNAKTAETDARTLIDTRKAAALAKSASAVVDPQ
tara:strand:+ start:1510 stop:1878 length:369 start_codon:yes stop_codon:yes gene_type:complete